MMTYIQPLNDVEDFRYDQSLLNAFPWMLQTLIIAREAFSPRSRGAVYRPDQSVSSWITFNLTAYHQQAQTVQGRMERSGRVRELLSDFAESAHLDERLVSAMHDVAMQGRVRRSRYERAEGLSLHQAQRDLRDLVSAQVLEPVGRTRVRYYVAGPHFPEQAQDVADTPMTLRPAYSA